MPPSVPVTQSPAARQRKKSPGVSKIKTHLTNATAAEKELHRAQVYRAAQKQRSSDNRNTANEVGSNAAPNSAASTATPDETSNPLNSTSLLGNTGMYGGAYGGMNMMNGMMGSPYYSSYGYGGVMMPGMAGQPFSGLNQFLFSIQSVIFSMGQAVQILGMNTQALHQLLDTVSTMFDHALTTWKEMRTLEAAAAESESEEDRKRRRRLRALRWAATAGLSFAIYKLIRRFLFTTRRRRGAGRRLLGDGSTYRPYGQHGPSGHGSPTTTGYYGNGYGGSYSSSPYGSPFRQGPPGPHGYHGGGFC